MNLLQRSISNQQSSATQSQSRPTAHKPTHSHHTTNTHLLFHLNDPGDHYGDQRYDNGASYPMKKKGSKGGGFPEMQNSNSTFDYYEYFSNYGRLLASPPQSPVGTDAVHEGRAASASRAGATTPAKSEENGSKKFWKRTGSTPKYMPVKSTDSPEKHSQIHQGVNSQSASPATPRQQSQRVSRKTSQTPSPSSPPPFLYGEAAPLISPPSDPPMLSISSHNGASASVPYRISFIETNVYIPVDLQTSPQHLPHHRRMGPNHYFHQEWVQNTVQQLRQQFKLSLNQILVNVEKKAKYPFIIFGSPGPGFDSAGPIVPTATSNTLSPELRITDGLYDICSALTRPNSGYSDDDTKRPLGYIISAFQTFPGEDSEKLENNWMVWTGAGILYKYLPTAIGLRRLIFFKRHDLHLLKLLGRSQLDNEIPIFTYVLITECFNLRESYLPTACSVIDQLRARCCGYSALYINQL
ncbi:hypothetical protein B4U80_08566 [Leptotrombidium deliense]|uniref:DUF7153 domain-containing protein n=1 Tax=Leptotrombidium deliense TaxID=299467 RepID=A0A443SBC4_9ACAR|nr:hypothetical protein B4U80_08566 [Leptotrombidium deliense]